MRYFLVHIVKENGNYYSKGFSLKLSEIPENKADKTRLNLIYESKNALIVLTNKSLLKIVSLSFCESFSECKKKLMELCLRRRIIKAYSWYYNINNKDFYIEVLGDDYLNRKLYRKERIITTFDDIQKSINDDVDLKEISKILDKNEKNIKSQMFYIHKNERVCIDALGGVTRM